MGLLDKADSFKSTIKEVRKGGLLKSSIKFRSPEKEDHSEAIQEEKIFVDEVIDDLIDQEPNLEAPLDHRIITHDSELEIMEETEDLTADKSSGDENIPVEDNLKYLIEDMKENLSNVQGERELSDYLTAIFVKYLDVENIACLILDPVTDCFIPWNSIGISPATKEKLRLPKKMVKQILKSQNISEAQESGMDPYSPYFNHTDFFHAKNIVALPFFWDEKLLGLVLIINLADEYLGRRELANLFTENLNNKEILRNRFEKIEAIEEYSFISRQHLTNELEKQIEYANTNQTVLEVLVLPLVEAVKPILIDYPLMNTWQLQEDLLLLLGKLFKHMGHVYNTKNGNIIFFISKLRQFDMEVLQDQLLNTIKHFFEDIIKENMFTLPFKAFAYPTDGKDAVSLTENFL